MNEQYIFVVNCERIPRRQSYYLRFQYNDGLVGKIKNLPEETRKWNAGMLCWEISIASLYKLIKRYKGSRKIHFDFGNDDSRKIFINKIKKVELKEEEKRKFIAELNVNKEHWVRYKEELELTYKQYSEKLHKFLKSSIILYPHQIIAALFMNITRSTLISHEMGLGKTLSAILYVEMNGFEKVIVVTPNSLKFNFRGEVNKFTESNSHIINWNKNTCGIEEAKYIIVNYDFFNPDVKKGKFITKWKKLNIDKIDAVICDECFPYNTPILTNKGILKIGDIVKYKINVKILTYNHKLKKIELKSIKRYLYRGVKNVVVVKLSNGDIIECTPDHKFYSVDRDKYISIKDFNYGERLYKKKENSYENSKMSSMWYRIQTKTKFAKILFKELFGKLYYEGEREKSVKNKGIKWEFVTINNKNLSDLQERISIEKTSQAKILFNKLFCKMENETTRNKKTSLYKRVRRKNIKSINNKLQEQTRIENPIIKTNEIKQSNVQSRFFGKDEKKINGKNIFIKGWKWTINKTTIISFFRNIWNNKNENGISNTNINTITENKYRCGFTTNTLQSRYWNIKSKVSNRSGWGESQDEEMEIFGQEKDNDIEIVGVESVEVLESRDRQRFGTGGSQNKKVFDLEIEDNHNYFANGILVSNCHKLKNTKSNTYKNFKSTFKKSIFRDGKISKIFLSGTPAPNRAHELYTVLNQISIIDFPTKKHFYGYYCGMKYDISDGWGYVTNTAEQKLEELFHKIAPYTHRKHKKEVLTDLPDKTYQRILLEMTDDEQRTYNRIEAGVANDFVENPTSNPLTIMIRLRQYLATIKVKHVVDLIQNVHETGEKTVVVDFFKDSLYELKELLGNNAALHTGDQDVEERAMIVETFQDPNSNITDFLGSIQTCNYGLTLTAASKLFIITLPYSVGEYDQVSDRLHRIGQKSAVNIYVLVFPDTIDDYVFSAIEGKRKEIVKVIDNEDYSSNVSESVLSEVIKKIKEKYGK